jgi:hypothetical protein
MRKPVLLAASLIAEQGVEHDAVIVVGKHAVYKGFNREGLD